MNVRTAAPHLRSGDRPAVVSILLLCGVLAAGIYVVADLVGALSWPGYSYTGQSVSELMAIDSPVRPTVLPFFIAYNVLTVAFGMGTWAVANRAGLRVTAAMLVVIGLLGLPAATFGAMHLRGTPATFNDMLHIALTIATVPCTVVAIGFAANAFGRRFLIYSIATLAVLLIFGVLGALDGPRVAANLPTPWLGVTERLCIGSYLLWTAVLAVVLLRAGRREGV